LTQSKSFTFSTSYIKEPVLNKFWWEFQLLSRHRKIPVRTTTGIWLFAECHILCRVFFFRALGKEALCRVPRKKPSVKENTRRRSSLSSVLFLTLGKEFLCRVSFFDTRQIQHSAKSSLPSVFSPTLGKDKLKITF
jgi:hypothetical protein